MEMKMTKQQKMYFTSILRFMQQWKSLLKDQEKEKLLEPMDKICQQMPVHRGHT